MPNILVCSKDKKSDNEGMIDIFVMIIKEMGEAKTT